MSAATRLVLDSELFIQTDWVELNICFKLVMKGTDTVGMPNTWQNTACMPGDDSWDVQDCV